MLKFLQNRKHEAARKVPKKYKPGLLYGISYQTPPQFQTDSSILFEGSYLNPFLQLQAKRKNLIKEQKLKKVRLGYFRKQNPIYSENQQIFNHTPNQHNIKQSSSDFQQAYISLLQNDPNYFHITRGPFRDFIQQNYKYQKIYGPLLGKQRSYESVYGTRKSIYEKSRQNLAERSKQLASCQLTTASQTFSLMSKKNSELITKYTKLRQNRISFNRQMSVQLQNRKKSDRFETGVKIIPNIRSRKVKKHKKETKETDTEDNQAEYEQFTEILQKRFK